MDVKKLIGNNVLNVAIFALILFFSDYLSVGATAFLIVVWAAYLIYSNYQLVFQANSIIHDLQKANKGAFDTQVKKTKMQLKSLQGRRQIFKDIDPEKGDPLEEIYSKCETQFLNNTKYLVALMNSFDYYSKPKDQIQLINDIVHQNDLIITKLNQIIEKEILVEKSVHDNDLESVDDLIDSLEELLSESAN